MRNFINIINEGLTPPTQRKFWYRGVESIRPSQVGHRPIVPPQEIATDLKEEGVDRIYQLSNYEFRISRTYAGMSNWGFGVYMTTSIPWAARYGQNIIVSEIDPSSILTIAHRDFVDRAEGTSGGKLAELLYRETDSMREQAPIMFQMVKKIKRNAKALFVQTDEDGHGQICVGCWGQCHR